MLAMNVCTFQGLTVLQIRETIHCPFNIFEGFHSNTESIKPEILFFPFGFVDMIYKLDVSQVLGEETSCPEKGQPDFNKFNAHRTKEILSFNILDPFT